MSDEPHRVNWKVPLAVSVGGTVVGGLVLLGLSPLVKHLSTGQAFLVLGGAVLLGLLATVAWTAVRVVRAVNSWWEWRISMTDALVQAQYEIRRLWLMEVVHSAKVSGWAVDEDADGDLEFVAPDGGTYYVRAIRPDPYEIAQALHDTSPDHFQDDWRAWINSVSMDAALAHQAAVEVDERVDQLEGQLHDVAAQAARATLGVVEREARAAGWTVRWDDVERRLHLDKSRPDGGQGAGSTGVSMPYDGINPEDIRTAIREGDLRLLNAAPDA
jgi:hypothetical protein